MKKNKGKLYIGTSGYVYPHWEKGVFYPPNLPKTEQLRYCAQHFNTVELNYPFYRLPSVKSFSRWAESVPEGFVFSVKVSRYITHIKRLHNIKTAWNVFLKRALRLKEKLGPFLFQFPPSFRATEENIQRLENFLRYFHKTFHNKRTIGALLKMAVEFRDETWRQEKIYKLLRECNAAWVVADSPDYPKAEVVTADFVYIRMHGGKVLYGSNYLKKELRELAEIINRWLDKKLNVYVYFNNDAAGYAPKNAKKLLKLVKSKY